MCFWKYVLRSEWQPGSVSYVETTLCRNWKKTYLNLWSTSHAAVAENGDKLLIFNEFSCAVSLFQPLNFDVDIFSPTRDSASAENFDETS